MNGHIIVEKFESGMGSIVFKKPLKISWWEMDCDENGIVVEIFLNDGINWAERFSLDAWIPFSKIESFDFEDVQKTVEKSVHFDFDHAFFHYQGDPNYGLTHWAIYGNFKDEVEIIEPNYDQETN